MLGKLKWRKSCSGFRSRRAGLWPASDLPGHCLNSVPACKYSKSGSTLDKNGSVSWNFWGPGGLASPPGSKKSCDSAGKESTCNARDLGLIPGLERSPGERKGYPLQDSGLENSIGCIVHGVTKSQTRLSDVRFHFSHVCYHKGLSGVPWAAQ